MKCSLNCTIKYFVDRRTNAAKWRVEGMWATKYFWDVYVGNIAKAKNHLVAISDMLEGEAEANKKTSI